MSGDLADEPVKARRKGETKMTLRTSKQRRIVRRNARTMSPIITDAKQVLRALDAMPREKWTQYAHGFEPCHPSVLDEMLAIASGQWQGSRKAALDAVANGRNWVAK